MQIQFQVIYINGPSSAGKTTLARKLQEDLLSPFLYISIDQIIDMMPQKLNDWEGSSASLGFSWKPAQDANSGMHLYIGPFGKKIVQTFRKIILTTLKMGHSVIIDDVAFGKEDVDIWKTDLKGYNVLWIGLNAPLQILEEREKLRGNRMHGSARAQRDKVHQDVVYDAIFDTGKDSLERIAQTIIDLCTEQEDYLI